MPRSPSSRLLFPLCASLLLTCNPPVQTPEPDATSRAALRTSAPARPDEHQSPVSPGERPTRPGAQAPGRDAHVRPFQRCFPEDSALSPPRSLLALLDRAAELYDQAGQLSVSRERRAGAGLDPRTQTLLQSSLVCADEAARVEPRSVEAHHARAVASLDMGEVEAARDAFTRALAIDPDDLKTLAAAADLYINHLAPGVDHTETGLEYARRGSRRARRHRDKGLIARLALLEGQALNDLGHAREALSRLDASLAAEDDVQARYERGVALFDLCRFQEARRAFTEVTSRAPEDAWAHQHLGLVLEAIGQKAEAERAFATAHRLQPQDFPEPLRISPTEFRTLVDREVSKLSPALQKDLGQVSLETADLPDHADLTAEEPPLSPTILGLFRGAPLGEGPERDAAPRTIVLYRKNLLRAVSTQEDLETQVRTTLLHELGHLRGEDDEALRARGLE